MRVCMRMCACVSGPQDLDSDCGGWWWWGGCIAKLLTPTRERKRNRETERDAYASSGRPSNARHYTYIHIHAYIYVNIYIRVYIYIYIYIYIYTVTGGEERLVRQPGPRPGRARQAREALQAEPAAARRDPRRQPGALPRRRPGRGGGRAAGAGADLRKGALWCRRDCSRGRICSHCSHWRGAGGRASDVGLLGSDFDSYPCLTNQSLVPYAWICI